MHPQRFSYLDMSELDEDWIQCSVWLNQCHILPLDMQNSQPDSQDPSELVAALNDGVIMCQLLDFLSHGDVNIRGEMEFYPNPELSQFKCLSNIRLFLRISKEYFAMPVDDLFDPFDLYRAKNFGKVVRLLSKISKTSIALETGICGFPKEDRSVEVDHEYYNNLEDFTDTICNDSRKTHTITRSNATDEEDEISTGNHQDDVYQTIVHQGVPRPEEQPLTKRQHCIQEIVTTEKNYVDTLRMLIDSYKKPLTNVLGPNSDVVEIIFRYIEELHTVHRELHTNLTLAVTSNQLVHLSLPQVFLQIKDRLLIYGRYCGHMPQAENTVLKLLKQEENRANLEMCQKKSSHPKFQLVDLLKIPMQRILKYHLLLDTLFKQTDDAHKDKQAIKTAANAMRAVATSINEVKRDLETISAIDQIQASISGIPADLGRLSSHGHLLMDGEMKVAPDGDNKTKLRHLFLFDKTLLICKSKGSNYSYITSLKMASSRVVDITVQTKKGDKWAFAFLFEIDNVRKCTFYTKSNEFRISWIKAMQLAQDNLNPPGALQNGLQFELTTFEEPVYCSVCNELLKGVFFQGYQCAKTRIIAHKDCLKDAEPPANCLRRTPLPPSITSSPQMSKLRATQSYAGTQPSPPMGRTALSFAANDLIDLVNKTDATWWERHPSAQQGRIQGRQGHFPSSLVVEYRNFNPRDLSSYSSSEGRVSYDETGYIEYSHDQVFEDHLNKFVWYAGEMDRIEATRVLQGREDGTFLVRVSKSAQRMGEYSLSLVFSQPKHIRVCRHDDGRFFLSERETFPSIQEMIQHYRETTLEQIFTNLNISLKIPFRETNGFVNQSIDTPTLQPETNMLFYATAIYDFLTESAKQLSLHRGDKVAVLSTSAQQQGWWKGRINGKIGFFPVNYVTIDES